MPRDMPKPQPVVLEPHTNRTRFLRRVVLAMVFERPRLMMVKPARKEPR